MISNVRKHQEKQKLADRFPQPFVNSRGSVQEHIANMSKMQKKKSKKK
jgi:hypothetical protein